MKIREANIDNEVIPWLHVVNSSGTSWEKNNFLQFPAPRRYIEDEFIKTTKIASALAAEKIIDGDMPILYPETGGKIAALAVQKVTGGAIYPLSKKSFSNRDRMEIPTPTKEAILNARKIIVCDDNVFTGVTMYKMMGALKEHIKCPVAIIANRFSSKPLSPHRWPRNSWRSAFPENSDIYIGGIFTGQDRIKMSDMIEKLGINLETVIQNAEKAQANSPPLPN